MFLTRTEYDRGVNTFSPEGRLFQVEYAIEAIKLGSTAIGLKTKEGVVLAVEKRITSPLLEPSSVEKIMEIDDHIGCAMSGLIADARTLVEHARVETQNHRFSYSEPMTVESTTQALCDLALRFGEGDEESMSRPFGVSLLIAGHDEHGPSLDMDFVLPRDGSEYQTRHLMKMNHLQSCENFLFAVHLVFVYLDGWVGGGHGFLHKFSDAIHLSYASVLIQSQLMFLVYYTDPSGTFWQCNAKAIGSGSEGADSSLQEQYNKVTPNNVDIAKVAPNYHLYSPTEVEAVITRL
ncbi:hypothetical protein Scep_025077 [Stephania cephalantha]|uniref:Proteasome subunit alpha type n=1 Tax=Stephania cephalantha TaxID=152367 RepID=A0AAP0F0L6_9MAGN